MLIGLRFFKNSYICLSHAFFPFILYIYGRIKKQNYLSYPFPVLINCHIAAHRRFMYPTLIDPGGPVTKQNDKNLFLFPPFNINKFLMVHVLLGRIQWLVGFKLGPVSLVSFMYNIYRYIYVCIKVAYPTPLNRNLKGLLH